MEEILKLRIVGRSKVNGYQKCSNQSEHNSFFLFVGVKGSGKSTAIRKLFNLERRETYSEDDACFRILRTESAVKGQPKQNCFVVEGPGFKSFICSEENEYIRASISTFLRRVNVVPEYIVITARLNDSRFDGNQSEFCNSLRTVKTLLTSEAEKFRQYKIILLFTHGDRPDVLEDLYLDRKIARYKDIVHSIFELAPILVNLDTPESITDNVFKSITGRKWNASGEHFHSIDEINETNGIGNGESKSIDCETCKRIFTGSVLSATPAVATSVEENYLQPSKPQSEFNNTSSPYYSSNNERSKEVYRNSEQHNFTENKRIFDAALNICN